MKLNIFLIHDEYDDCGIEKNDVIGNAAYIDNNEAFEQFIYESRKMIDTAREDYEDDDITYAYSNKQRFFGIAKGSISSSMSNETIECDIEVKRGDKIYAIYEADYMDDEFDNISFIQLFSDESEAIKHMRGIYNTNRNKNLYSSTRDNMNDYLSTLGRYCYTTYKDIGDRTEHREEYFIGTLYVR